MPYAEVDEQLKRLLVDFGLFHHRMLDRGAMGFWLYHFYRYTGQEGGDLVRAAAEKLSAEGSMRTPERLRVLAKVLAVQSNFVAEPTRRAELQRRSLALLEGPELAEVDTRREEAFVLLMMGGGHWEFPAPEEAKEPAVEPNTDWPTEAQPLIDKAITDLGNQSRSADPQVQVLSVEAVQWPDGCMGCAQEGEMCILVITPGYRILLEMDGQEYEYRTSQNDVRYCPAADADTGTN